MATPGLDLHEAAEVARRFVALSGHAAAELLTMSEFLIVPVQQRLLADTTRRLRFRPSCGVAPLPKPKFGALDSGEQRALLIDASCDERGPLVHDSFLLGGWCGDRFACRTNWETTIVNDEWRFF